MQIRVAGVYGGVNMVQQTPLILAGLDVLVATPGRLLDFVLNGSLKLKSVKRFIIDEVDEMLNLGFRPQLIRIIDLLPIKRQNLMFSATITEELKVFIADFLSIRSKLKPHTQGRHSKTSSKPALKCRISIRK